MFIDDEERMRAVRELLKEAERISQTNVRAADAVIAHAANVLAGVVHRRSKVIDLQAHRQR
jgi:hypothetical protein